MRIGMLSTSFPRFEHDIAGNFVLGMARALVERGHALEVLAPEPLELGSAPAWPGVHVEYVPYLRPRVLQRTFYGAGVPDNVARDPLAALGLAPFSLALAAVARRRAARWDAIISHWALPCALAAGLARSRQRHVAVLHSADVQLLSRLPGRRGLARWIARGSDALWFVNASHERSFQALLPRDVEPPRTFVSPMGIALPPPACAEERAQFRRRHQLQGFVVLALGRLVPIKGLEVAIRAAADSGMTLVLAGEGPERGALERHARACGAHVRFPGLVTGDDKRAWLRAADAFVLPSLQLPSGRSEGLPTALLEAMAHALPVVCSRLPGVAEMLEGAAALTPAGDSAALRAALLALRADPSAAAQLAVRGHALAARFTWSRIGPQLEDLLGFRSIAAARSVGDAAKPFVRVT